jgi:hypothetical protein
MLFAAAGVMYATTYIARQKMESVEVEVHVCEKWRGGNYSDVQMEGEYRGGEELLSEKINSLPTKQHFASPSPSRRSGRLYSAQTSHGARTFVLYKMLLTLSGKVTVLNGCECHSTHQLQPFTLFIQTTSLVCSIPLRSM